MNVHQLIAHAIWMQHMQSRLRVLQALCVAAVVFALVWVVL